MNINSFSSSSSSSSIDDFDVGQKIGSGGFGHVFRARKRDNNKYVSIKIIDRQAIQASAILTQRIAAEIAIHGKLKHENIVKLYEVFEDRNFIYIAMELCVHGNLFKYFQAHFVDFGPVQVSCILKQLLLALQYLHGNKIVHRDVKLSNILISKINEGK